MFKKSGPAKVEAAFGLFTKAINDLEAAVVTCNDEATSYRDQAQALKAKALASEDAAGKAETAIANLRGLIGG